MEKTKISVVLAGQEFKLAATESEEYILELAQYVNQNVEEIQQRYPNLSTANCVLLASLNMADELHKLRADYDALDQRIAQLREMPRSAVPQSPVKRPFEARQPVGTK
ncbi:MAG: cell division protein ZapA [Clostridia bacterium]|nr:cell division protein ZapA [Clostridia bacterium]MBQ7114438.1 cell division protein ZapA [Clostridia bacterium]